MIVEQLFEFLLQSSTGDFKNRCCRHVSHADLHIARTFVNSFNEGSGDSAENAPANLEQWLPLNVFD
jgi:hypothetical protein